MCREGVRCWVGKKDASLWIHCILILQSCSSPVEPGNSLCFLSVLAQLISGTNALWAFLIPQDRNQKRSQHTGAKRKIFMKAYGHKGPNSKKGSGLLSKVKAQVPLAGVCSKGKSGHIEMSFFWHMCGGLRCCFTQHMSRWHLKSPPAGMIFSTKIRKSSQWGES